MDALGKLRINLQCLIRLTKTELYDSLNDIKRNIELIKHYTEIDSVKYEALIKELEYIKNIHIDSVIAINNKLKSYYKDLNELKNNTVIEETNKDLENINKLHSLLEESISKLEMNKLNVIRLNKIIKLKGITVISSETEYLVSEVLRNYETLNEARLKYYNNKHSNVLTKKYN